MGKCAAFSYRNLTHQLDSCIIQFHFNGGSRYLAQHLMPKKHRSMSTWKTLHLSTALNDTQQCNSQQATFRSEYNKML